MIRIRSKEFGLLLILAFLLGIFVSMHLVKSQTKPTLELIKNDVSLTHACSYYRLNYQPSGLTNQLKMIDLSTKLATLKISSAMDVYGTLKNVKIELKINKIYQVKVPDYITKYKIEPINQTNTTNLTLPPTCTQINQSYINCSYVVQAGYHNETRYKWEWVPIFTGSWNKKYKVYKAPDKFTLHTDKIANNMPEIFNTLVKGNSIEFRVCGDYEPELTPEGWSVAIDHIPSFDSQDYTKFTWWNSTWQYRRPITITENSGNTLSNYQVGITLDTASLISDGKMNSDCSDIRFIDSDNTTELSYWIESGCNSTSTKIWVKIPSIPANSTKTIYMYYGNPSATSQSNGDNVFIFFDDFESGSLSKWDSTGSWSVVSDTVKQGDYSVYRAGGAADRLEKYNLNLNYTVMVHLWAFTSSTDTTAGYPHLYKDDGGVDVYSMVFYNSQIEYYQGSFTPWPQNSAFSTNTWYKLELVFDFQNGIQKGWKNGLYMGEIPLKNGNGAAVNKIQDISLHTSALTGGMWVDEVYIRKYTSPEPTYSIGAEEIANQPPFIPTFFEPPDPSTYNYDATYTFKARICDPDNNLPTTNDISSVIFEFGSTNYTVTNKVNYNATCDDYNITLGSLAAGTYTYRWYTNDSQNVWNSTAQQTFTVNKATPTLSISGTGTYTYPYTSTVSGSESNLGDSDVTYNLYRDGILVTNPETIELGAGSYTYEFNTTGGQNYTSASITSTLIINKAPVNVDIYFSGNGTTIINNNYIIGFGKELNVTACTNITKTEQILSTNFKLYKDNTEVGTLLPNKCIEYLATLPVGHYYFNASFLGNENYTTFTRDPSVDVTAPQYSNIKTSPSLPTTYNYDQTYQFNITWQTSNASVSDLDTVIIEHNFTGVLQNYTVTTYYGNADSAEYYYTFPSLSVGTYAYKWYANDTNGGWNSTPQYIFTISKATPTLSLFCTNTTYPNNLTCTASENNNGDNDLTYNFYLNNSLISSGSSINYSKQLAAGIYNLTYNTSGGQNYTASSISILAQIYKHPASLDILLNETYYSSKWINNNTIWNITILANESSIPIKLITNYSEGNISALGFSNQTITIKGNEGAAFYFKVDLNDSQNYTASSKQILLKIDASPPTKLNMTDLYAGSVNYNSLQQPHQFNITVMDPLSGIDLNSVRLEFGGVNYTPDYRQINSTTYKFYKTLTGIQPGSYLVRWYVADLVDPNWLIASYTYNVYAPSGGGGGAPLPSYTKINNTFSITPKELSIFGIPNKQRTIEIQICSKYEQTLTINYEIIGVDPEIAKPTYLIIGSQKLPVGSMLMLEPKLCANLGIRINVPNKNIKFDVQFKDQFGNVEVSRISIEVVSIFSQLVPILDWFMRIFSWRIVISPSPMQIANTTYLRGNLSLTIPAGILLFAGIFVATAYNLSKEKKKYNPILIVLISFLVATFVTGMVASILT